MGWSRRPSDRDADANDETNPLADNMRLNRARRSEEKTQGLDDEHTASIYDQQTVVDSNFSNRSQARRQRQGATPFTTQQLGTWAADPGNTRKLLVIGAAFVIFLLILAFIKLYGGSSTGAVGNETGATAAASEESIPGAFITVGPVNSAEAVGAQPVATVPGSNPAEQPPAASPAGQAFVVSGTGVEGLFLRKDPTTGGEILGTLPEGTAVEATGEQQNADGYDWKKVHTPQGDGWVAAQFLQPSQ